MIPNSINALFSFIDYLDSNKSLYIDKYIPLENEIIELSKQREKLNPDRNYKEKKQYDLIQNEIKKKVSPFYDEVTFPILEKLKELKLWQGDDTYTSIYNSNIDAVILLTQNFSENDLISIQAHKEIYLSFRKETDSYLLSLRSLFDYLDRLLKVLFDFFSDDEQNEKIPFDVNTFNFSPDVFLKSKADFQIFLNQRFGDQYEPYQLNKIVDKYYGENREIIRQEAQEQVNAKAYIPSNIYYYEFKKSMEDDSSNRHHIKLQRTWDESRKKYIEENGLEKIANGWDSRFSNYLNLIFSIYRHAFLFVEKNSIKDMKQIALKKAKFDWLMNEQTDHLISNLKSEKYKGNYKMVLDRKDYVLELFNSLESFLTNASIRINKSPFESIFKESQEKIKNCISFEEIKFLANHTKQNTFSEEQKRLKIAFEIVGENNSRTKSIMYHHIPAVLEKYSLNNIEAKNILLTASGGFHLDTQTIIIPKIVAYLKEIENIPIPKNNVNKELPITFEELFYNTKNAEICLNILRELEPKVIDGLNNYIGKAKGIFPLWLQVLKTFNPKPLIKHFPDKVYKDLLNKKINGLNLSQDASEFRKTYKRLANNNIELDIKTILSQYSQDGKLGK